MCNTFLPSFRENEKRNKYFAVCKDNKRNLNKSPERPSPQKPSSVTFCGFLMETKPMLYTFGLICGKEGGKGRKIIQKSPKGLLTLSIVKQMVSMNSSRRT